MTSTTTPVASCSFCAKANTEVDKIVAGPAVYICNGCVELCSRVIAQVADHAAGVAPAREPSEERTLTWLSSMVRTLRAVESDIGRQVTVLRERGGFRIGGASILAVRLSIEDQDPRILSRTSLEEVEALGV